MKTINLWKWSLGAVLAVLPFLGCSQKNYTYQPTPTVVRVEEVPAPVAIAPVPVTNNVPPPVAEERSLEDAPVQAVSSAQAPSNTISPAAAEIVKLAQSGVDEGVMLTYVTNSARVFNLTSDDLVYLNDVGVPASVVTAMLQRDQLLKTSANAALASAPQAYTNPMPYTTAEQPAEVQQETAVVAQAPEPVAAPNVSYTYFYDSLSPYGTWVDVDGYGRCWRPTVVVVNPGWQPYCDSGHWVYSDCGWYWASDYSWGWAPFHYGRWFRHSRMGWCWAPDTVWGPSWVSWRYTDDYCGWAPLPPAACYTPGVGFTYYGRSVGVSFSFGLTARHYAFVPVRNFYDRHPGRYRLPEHNVINIYNHTTVVHSYEHGDRGRIINRGIPVEHVRTAAHADIRPIAIRDTDRPANAHIQRDAEHGRTLDVFRPPLPQPHGTTRLVGEGVQPATRQNAIGHANPTTRSPQAIRAPQSEPNRPAVRNTPAITHESIRNPRDRDNQNDNRLNNPAPVVRNTPPVVNPSPAPTTAPQPNPARDNNRDNRITPAAPNREPVIIRNPGRSGSISNPRESGGNRVVTPPAQSPPTRIIPTLPTRQFTPAPAPVTPPPQVSQPQAPRQQTPRTFRQETPSIRAPQSVITQPSAPVRQESAPRISPPPANSIQRQQPRIETPAPRIETRSAPQPPAIQRAPTPAPSQPSAPSGSIGRQDRGSRSDGQDRNNRPGR